MLPLTWGDSPRRGKHGFGPSGSWAAPTSHTPTKRRPSVTAMHGDSCIAQADVPRDTPGPIAVWRIEHMFVYGRSPVGRGAWSRGCRSGRGGIRRAALPFELLVPRRCEPSRGAGRGSGAARARGAGDHRPRRFLRRRPLRGGGPRGRSPDRLRRRADARRDRAPERDPRSGGGAPDRARAGPGRVLAAGEGDQRGAARGGEGDAAHVDRAPRRRGARRPCTSPATSPPARTTTGSCSRAAARGACPPRCNATVPPRPGGRCASWCTRSAATACSWSCGTTAIRSTATATTRSCEVALQAGVEVVATNNVHYATPARRPLATALAAVRSRRSLDEVDGWLPAGSFAHLRSAREQQRRFARWPGAVERTVEIARACAFDLKLAAPRLPDYPVPGRARRHVVVARARAARLGDRVPAFAQAPRARRCARSSTSSR